jgi:hypothetical protein
MANSPFGVLAMTARRALFSLFILVGCLRSGQAQVPAADAAAKQAERIATLEKSLTGAALVGHFTVTGADNSKLAPERYELGKVDHIQGEQWAIQARIKYGEHDVPIPLVLPIRWAGDTPVISVDEMAIPGLGTYTARVMIYRDHYAGFWTGKDHGGHLFGVIERAKAAEHDEAVDKARN